MKMYYFSFAKHAHDLEFRKNRLLNIIDSMYMNDGEYKYDAESIERMEKEIDMIRDIFRYWDGRPASKIPANLYGLAVDIVTWASNTRASTCISNGRYDLLRYC